MALVQDIDGQYLSAADASFFTLEHQDEFYGSIATLFILAETLDRATLVSHLEQFAKLDPRLSHRVELNSEQGAFARPQFRRDEKFSTGRHVQVVEVPSPGTEKELQEAIADVFWSPLPMDRPLWMIYLFTGLEGNKCAVYHKVHHALTDGEGYVRTFLTFIASLDPSRPDPSTLQYSIGKKLAKPASAQPETPSKPDTNTVSSFLRSFLADFPALLASIGIFLYSIYRLLRSPVRTSMWPTAGYNTGGGITVKGDTRFGNGGQRKKQIAWSKKIPMADVKMVKDALGVTVNDLIVTAVIAGVEGFLRRKGQEEKNDFWFLIPTSAVREPDDRSMSNQSSGWMVSLPSHAATPVSRLYDVSSRMKTVKKSVEPYVYTWLGKAAAYPFLIGQERIATITETVTERSMFHGAITNPPGPSRQLNWAGIPIERWIGFIPASTYAFSFCVVSYGDAISINLLTDVDHSLREGGKHMYSPGDARLVIKEIEEEFEKLKQQALDKVGWEKKVVEGVERKVYVARPNGAKENWGANENGVKVVSLVA